MLRFVAKAKTQLLEKSKYKFKSYFPHEFHKELQRKGEMDEGQTRC